MTLEHVSMALNPRGTLYKKRSLIAITIETGNATAVSEYRRRIQGGNWALYRVRRIYSARATAHRAVERLALFDDEESAERQLGVVAARLARPVERERDIPYVWCERRSETVFPNREEFMTIAPATVDSKARYGLAWFEEKWSAVQLPLF
jgi:hypothetical protein